VAALLDTIEEMLDGLIGEAQRRWAEEAQAEFEFDLEDPSKLPAIKLTASTFLKVGRREDLLVKQLAPTIYLQHWPTRKMWALSLPDGKVLRAAKWQVVAA
jgi:hypothetical protein